jgi:hypothetical protein
MFGFVLYNVRAFDFKLSFFPANPLTKTNVHTGVAGALR